MESRPNKEMKKRRHNFPSVISRKAKRNNRGEYNKAKSNGDTSVSSVTTAGKSSENHSSITSAQNNPDESCPTVDYGEVSEIENTTGLDPFDQLHMSPQNAEERSNDFVAEQTEDSNFIVTNSDTDESIYPDLLVEKVPAVGYDPAINQLSGRRIVDIRHLITESRKLESHECHMAVVKKGHFSYVREVKKGFASELVFSCTSCGETRRINTDGDSGTELNSAATWGVISIGKGHHHLEELFSLMDIPTPCFDTYQRHEEKIGNSWMGSLLRDMECAISEEIRMAVEKNEIDEDGIPWITVILDGGWSHRSYGHSYSAKSGVAVIIGKRTKKIIFVGVRQKYCSVCAMAEGRGETVTHKCYKNWDQSSTAMESDIIVEGFRLSETLHKLRYKRFVADGDSSVHKQIRELVPYGRDVIKVECTNHLIKNVGKKLFKIADVNAAYKKLLRNRAQKISKFARWLITVNATQSRPCVEALKADLGNVIAHAFGDHTKCRKQVCYDAGLVEPSAIELELAPTDFRIRINAVIATLISHASSLIENDTSNLAESYMHLVAKFTGGKQAFYGARGAFVWRTYAAGLAYQNGPNWHGKAWKETVGHSPGKYLKKVSIRRQKKRETSKRSLAKDYDDGSLALENKRSRSEAVAKKNPHYGENCQAPDWGEEEIMAAGNTLLELLQVTPERQAGIELATRGQATNERWFLERQRRLTCSNFGAICRRRAPPGPLVKSLLYAVSVNSAALNWGRDHEAVALNQYKNMTGTDVVSCGLFVDTEKGFLAGSPDGLVGDDSLLEIKCPYKWRDVLPIEAARGRDFYADLSSDKEIRLKKTHAYYYQVQGQLRVTGRKTCDFVIWTTRGINIETIYRDESFIEEMVSKLEKFYWASLMPEIVNSRRNRSMPIRETALTAPRRVGSQAAKEIEPV